MAEKVPGWLERVLLPQISELKGEFKVVHSEIKRLDQEIVGMGQRLDQKIDALDERLNQKLDTMDDRLNQKIDNLDQKLSQRIDSLDEKLTQRIDGVEKRFDDFDRKFDVTQRLATVEAKVQELESRR